MKLEQSFEVSAPLQRVWDALVDVERVAPCLPGAAVTGRNDDGSYNGEFKVKIGPTSAAYGGKLNMESVDEVGHQATMQAAGTDKRGQGGAKATIESSVEEVDGGTTKVNVSTDYHITGRLARFGRGGMIEEISNRLLREFATNLQAMLAGDGEGAAETADTAAVPETAKVSADDDVSAAGAAASAAAEGGAAATAASKGDAEGAAASAGGVDDSAGIAEKPQAAPRKDGGVAESGGSDSPDSSDAGSGAPDSSDAESGASDAEAAAAADEPPVPQAGSQGEPGDPAHAAEATDESDVSSGRASAPPDDPFAPPVAPPPPSGVPAGSAPPPPSSATSPPPEHEPMQGLTLVGGAFVKQMKDNPAPLVSALVAILVVLGLLRRRSR